MKPFIVCLLMGSLLFLSNNANGQPCDRMADSLALVEFYDSTNGAGWTNKWDLSMPMDTWFGVTLNGDGCVKFIGLMRIRG